MTLEPGTVLWSAVLPVEVSKARELARAVHSADDKWRGASHDELIGYPAVPTFTCTAGFWQDRYAMLAGALGLDMKRVLHGEQEYDFTRPVRVGEQLYGELRYAGCQQRPSRRGGLMQVHTLETTFCDAAGEPVVRERMILLQTAEQVR